MKRLKAQAIVLTVSVLTFATGVWSFGPLRPAADDPVPVIAASEPKVLTARDSLPPSVDCAAVACLALTFDDGPDPAITNRILDTLAAEKVHGTFFLVGSRAAAHPDTVRRIYEEGHEIGNHSWNHANLTKLSPAEVEDQVQKTQEAIMAAGVPAPHLFRPPYGAMNPMVKSHVPMALALWNVDPDDWQEKDPAKIVKRIEEQARPGRVVLMHDMHAPTADALGPAIEHLKGQYQFVTVSELFDIAPGQRGEFYGR